ncbi:unnamed protein product [Spirodela intermedia]|uniref:Uncharacterized protein n=2 Tax=Spirodela intermedia TaxID=51605 RepID=A0A7I8KCN9_SPIIN|nr:unnamed protein product [Spirodela intermedia]CAA6658752.1 unnamed protein product [Spirodela intermedia]CAA7395036.1 unnamed protein product [Spirodela intermedia]
MIRYIFQLLIYYYFHDFTN